MCDVCTVVKWKINSGKVSIWLDCYLRELSNPVLAYCAITWMMIYQKLPSSTCKVMVQIKRVLTIAFLMYVSFTVNF